MTDAKDPKLALFELYLSTAEKVSDRRAQANAWMLSVNSAIVALYGYLQADKMAVGAAQKAVWLWAIPVAGEIVCLAWVALLTSYRKLNRPSSPSSQRPRPICVSRCSRASAKPTAATGAGSLSDIERLIPGCFALLYAVMFVAAVVTRGG